MVLKQINNMTVIDLIIKLQKLPPNKEVILDFTKPGMEIFKLLGIHSVEEIEAGGQEFVMLTGMNYEEDETNLN